MSAGGDLALQRLGARVGAVIGDILPELVVVIAVEYPFVIMEDGSLNPEFVDSMTGTIASAVASSLRDALSGPGLTARLRPLASSAGDPVN